MKILTPDILFTMVFLIDSIKKRSTSGYFLDFDLAWRNLAPKIHNRRESGCYDILTDTLSKEGELLKVEFFGRDYNWLLRPINTKTPYISTTFSQSGFTIDPNDQVDVEIKVLSMLLWMMMEPNIEAVIKLLTGDMTLNIHDYFDHSDVMGFLNFHNHELSDKHEDIISYVMDKFKSFYVTYLGGNKDSEIFDLR